MRRFVFPSIIPQGIYSVWFRRRFSKAIPPKRLWQWIIRNRLCVFALTMFCSFGCLNNPVFIKVLSVDLWKWNNINRFLWAVQCFQKRWMPWFRILAGYRKAVKRQPTMLRQSWKSWLRCHVCRMNCHLEGSLCGNCEDVTSGTSHSALNVLYITNGACVYQPVNQSN